MGWDFAHPRRMLPKREGRIPVEDHPRRGLDQQRQEMTEDLRRYRDHSVGREQRSEHVRVAQRVSQGELRQHSGWQSEVDPDRENVPGPDAPAGPEDQLVTLKGVPEGFDERVGRRPAAIEDRAASDLDDVAEGKHRDGRRVRGSHNVPVEQALSHQQGLHVMAAVGLGLVRH